MTFLQPLLIALQFLTRLPVRLAGVPEAHQIGRSLLYYPLVGLMLGALLLGLSQALAGAPDLLRAALLLTVWVTLTGGMHLDGLADSADAWAGGVGDRERSLAIMKDPYCGPVAVATLVLVLLLKFAALSALPAPAGLVLLVAPVLGRLAIPLLFLTTPYVRPGGLGATLSANLPRAAVIAMAVVALMIVAVVGGRVALWMLATASAMFLLLRGLMQRRIGGTTGDTAGAMVELVELGGLVSAVL